jgi:hypothetical protein
LVKDARMRANRIFTEEELAKAEILVNALDVQEKFDAITKAHKAAKLAQAAAIQKAALKKNPPIDDQIYLNKEAELAGISAGRLIQARAIVQNLKAQSEIPYRSEPCDWAILYAFLEDEKSMDEKHIHIYLKRCDASVKKQELNMLLVGLEDYLAKNQNKKETKIYQDINAYCVQVRKNKDSIPTERLSDLTIAASRALFMVKNPQHFNNRPTEGINVVRGLNKGKEIYRQSWGKMIGGFFMSIMLFTLMAGIPQFKIGYQEKNLANHMHRLFSPQKSEVKVAAAVAVPPRCRMGSRQSSG